MRGITRLEAHSSSSGLVAALLVAALTRCGEPNRGQEHVRRLGNDGRAVRLGFEHRGDSLRSAELIAAFQRVNKNIRVSTRRSRATTTRRCSPSSRSRRPPDVFYVDSIDFPDYAKPGLLAPLDPYI